ncbi:hypothetical protein L5M43_14820 [Shewanella sp. SW36]|uniref:hypothetical protein n=1 Tax=Shewanella TaxID=22 RepID=UPI0021DA37E9|nr:MULTISPECIES: hypothetical protein [unclassified Shewanella]MCU7976513.1 hypothetical protein [Shewanella sp. SW36]MCU7991753.1 hypothetical protein [Shewanella sp. SW1]MCU8016015.1 hypothetical protein [Shewanella sp. SM72]MCU8053133.1 hypothetical protein [Shewanella sp. SM43]
MPFASRLKGSKLAVFSQVTLMNIAFSAALIFSVMGLSINANAADEAMPQEYIPLVQGLIVAAKANDLEALAKRVAYPLKREYPIPAIQNTQEMIARFDQVFDPKLLEQIAHSKIEADWQTMGWRGIMLGSGVVWLDFDGKIIAINYQTPVEAKLKAELIAKQQTALHPSVSEFVSPALSWETAKFTIRVDDMGNSQYRYAAWAKGKALSEKPDLVLNKGKLVFDGSGGNHSYQFRSGPYQYHCYVTVLGGSDSPLGELVVFKNDQEILTQAVIKAD